MKTQQDYNLSVARCGMTLLAVLILVIVASILAGSAALAWIRYYDLAARQNEKAALADIERAIRQSIMTHASIPRPADLLIALGAVSGRSMAQTVSTARGNPRVVLGDPEFGLGWPLGLGLPYVQTMNGSVEPRSPRLLLLSSAGRALPTNMVSGATLTEAQFSNLWNTVQGRAPADWNWNGNADDLCIQRIHLDNLFVRLTLQYYQDQPQHRGRYTLDHRGITTNAPALLSDTAHAFTSYAIRGSHLGLHGTNGTLQFRDILQDNDTVYTCRNGIWYRGTGYFGTRMGPTVRHPSPEELVDALMAFMDPQVPLWPENIQASKEDLLAAIINYLSIGAYDNQSLAFSEAQQALIDAWEEFTGVNANDP